MQYNISTFVSPGPIIFEYGPLAIRWYGILIALAVIIGLNLSNKLSYEKNIEKDLINDLLPFLTISTLAGARLYYVAFEWQRYKLNLVDIFAIWKGGIAIHGALIGALFAIWVFCRIRNQYFWDLLDILVPSFALGQAIGRWGNFFNNEAFGIPTNLPWKLFIPFDFRPIEFSNFEYFHPTFLYESIWNLIVFSVLIFIINRSKGNLNTFPAGTLSSIYLILYSLGRFCIEAIRTDPLCLGDIPPLCSGGIRIAQLMSIFLILIGSLMLWLLYKKKKKLPSLGTNERN